MKDRQMKECSDIVERGLHGVILGSLLCVKCLSCVVR